MKGFYSVVIAPIMVPFLIIFLLTNKRNYIFDDLVRWAGIIEGRQLTGTLSRLRCFYRLMIFHPEFRSLFYYRVRPAKLLSFLMRPMPALFIDTKDIGPGLFIQHGFSTIISAKKIGKNFWINQQVTIGYTSRSETPPTIGDDVTINAGAIVLGNVIVDDGAIVGAGAVVVKNVKRGSVVVGVPAKPIGATTD